VDKYDIRKNVQLKKRVTITEWVEEKKKWRVVVKDLATNTTAESYYNVMCGLVYAMFLPCDCF
jgi:cation diffusion facilitator CzcD-associated flavoprotein CzcO